MYACLCHAVRASELDAVIDEGARTLDEVGEACGAGTGCGACVPRLCARLARAAHADAMIAMSTPSVAV